MSLMRGFPKPVIVLSWSNNTTASPLKGVWVSAITAFHPST
jgi:hypothetical protein